MTLMCVCCEHEELLCMALRRVREFVADTAAASCFFCVGSVIPSCKSEMLV